MIIRIKDRIVNLANVIDICIGKDLIMFYFNVGIPRVSVIQEEGKPPQEKLGIMLACIQFKRVKNPSGKMPYTELPYADFDKLKKFLDTNSEIDVIC